MDIDKGNNYDTMGWCTDSIIGVRLYGSKGLSKRGYKNPSSQKGLDSNKVSGTILFNGLRS
jgi:hypothetical protein